MLTWFALDLPRIDAFPVRDIRRERPPSFSNVFRDEGYSRYRVNSLGLVGAEPEATTETRIKRVAVLGDSFVEAFQVAEALKFVSLVEQGLRIAQPHDRWEAWNVGFSGDNTGGEFARWERMLRPIRFEAVLFTFNDGDVLENIPTGSKDDDKIYLVRSPAGNYEILDPDPLTSVPRIETGDYRDTFATPLYGLYRLKIRAIDASRKSLGRVKDRLRGRIDSSSAVQMPDQSLLDQALETANQLEFAARNIEKHGPKVVVLGLPTSHTVQGLGSQNRFISARREAYAAIIAELRMRGIRVVDPLPHLESLARNGKAPYGLWSVGGHFNPLGHQTIARLVLEEFGKNLLK